MTRHRSPSARVAAALIAASALLAAPVARGEAFHPNAAMQAAKDALQHGNGKLALKLFADESQRGDGYADLSIGEIYFQGLGGVPRDNDRAVFWYVRAWERGGDVKANAAERLERVGEALGYTAKQVDGYLALGELLRLLPKRRLPAVTNSDPDPLGDYFGRKVFNGLTGNAFQTPFNQGSLFGD